MATKASKNPGDCGMLSMRCIGPSPKGEWKCQVTCGTGYKQGAVINEKKGTIRFYRGKKQLVKQYRGVEQVNCRSTPKGDLVVCTVTSRTAKSGVKNNILTLHYAGFSGDLKTYMTGTGLTSYRPKGGKMQCKVTDTRLECTTPQVTLLSVEAVKQCKVVRTYHNLSTNKSTQKCTTPSKAIIEKVLRKKFLTDDKFNMENSTFINGKKILIHQEPWERGCFPEADIEKAERSSNPDKFLTKLAEKYSHQMANDKSLLKTLLLSKDYALLKDKNKFDGVVFIEPEASGEEFGWSIIYKRAYCLRVFKNGLYR